MNKICKHYYISGQVQGVCYRHYAKRYAHQLNITGWIRNLSDGRVEALACGSESSINEFELWLKKGPEIALVDHIAMVNVPYENHMSFIITG